MKYLFRDFAVCIISILVLIFFFYFLVNDFIKKPTEIINFIDSDINEDFEIEITNNLDNINNYLKGYKFIESYLVKRKDNEINLQINLKRSFAINKSTKEVIFFDNTIAPTSYFKISYLDSIDLVDISKNSIHINNYLNENYLILSSLFDIDQIEYVDERRYNLVLRNGKVVMLPKMIDSKLIYFIKNNIDLIEKSTNFEEYLDFRNFQNKTIRLK